MAFFYKKVILQLCILTRLGQRKIVHDRCITLIRFRKKSHRFRTRREDFNNHSLRGFLVPGGIVHTLVGHELCGGGLTVRKLCR
jgi:hypothetical protein